MPHPTVTQLQAIQEQLREGLADDDQGLVARALHHLGEAITCLEADYLSATPRETKLGEQFEVVAVADSHISYLKGIPEIDNLTLSPGDAVLLIGQRNAHDNGIWIIRDGDWARPIQPSLTNRVGVTDGLLHADSVYVCAGPGDYSQIPVRRRGL